MHSPFRISCGNAQVLARSLPAFARLEVLHLVSNAIADAGAAAIVQACASQGTVKQLYLHRNRLTSHSAAAIGSALESSSCRLELLQLGGNMLGDTGVKRIAVALRGQTSLITLDVVGTPCSTARAFLTHVLAVKQPLDRYWCRGGMRCAALQRQLAGFEPERKFCDRQGCWGDADGPWFQRGAHLRGRE
jgi:Leucine Rich repeat